MICRSTQPKAAGNDHRGFKRDNVSIIAVVWNTPSEYVERKYTVVNTRNLYSVGCENIPAQKGNRPKPRFKGESPLVVASFFGPKSSRCIRTEAAASIPDAAELIFAIYGHVSQRRDWIKPGQNFLF